MPNTKFLNCVHFGKPFALDLKDIKNQMALVHERSDFTWPGSPWKSLLRESQNRTAASTSYHRLNWTVWSRDNFLAAKNVFHIFKLLQKLHFSEKGCFTLFKARKQAPYSLASFSKSDKWNNKIIAGYVTKYHLKQLTFVYICTSAQPVYISHLPWPWMPSW